VWQLVQFGWFNPAVFMMTFLREFQSWYWNWEFDDPQLQESYDATNTATTPGEFERVFLVLLRSNDTVARGTALDFFDRAQATSRFGEENPFEAHRQEVVAVARELLRQPPRPADVYAKFEGANHASALLTLKNDTSPEDTDAVVRILERRPEGELRFNALMVAGNILEKSPTSDPRLVALIAEIAFERSLDVSERVEALHELLAAPGDEVTALLERAAEDDEWRIQQEAAWALSLGRRFYTHRPLLERLAGTWSDDERSFGSGEVRDALADGPHSLYWEGCELDSTQLREAHLEIRSPTGEESHRQAFRTMLHSGHTVAVGIALDHFHCDDGLTRFGLDVQEYAPQVRGIAQAVLAQPPSPATFSPETGAGANHASALHTLQVCAEPEDADPIVAALRMRDVPSVVRERAIHAASSCLERWEVPDDRVIAALEEIIFDESVDLDERTDAVNALFDLNSPQATAILVRATHCAELPIQVEAALGLTYEHLIDEHRNLLRNLVASWPEDNEYRAWQVRQAVQSR
jgi:HEAT repeat protein